MIAVTKTFLPPFEEYTTQLKRAWDKAWITNNGELVNELETKLKEYLGVKHLLFCTNGTIVLQMALKVLGLSKEIITTPFSYVATTNAILWENCKPVFVDINKNDFCIDASKIEAAITEGTEAILATHVYGYPCDVEAIERIAAKYNLRIIYDAAHAFAAQYKNKQILSYGDITTCSFHATKLFHTVEGGCIITNDDALAEQLYLFRSFGHIGDNYYTVGINGKNSEFHAAMGLCNLPHLPEIINRRKKISELYDSMLLQNLTRPTPIANAAYNYAYYPVVFKNEEQLLLVKKALEENNIFSRRYFYPSLNKLPFIKNTTSCPVSEDSTSRVLCLPLYDSLSLEDAEKIAGIVLSVIN